MTHAELMRRISTMEFAWWCAFYEAEAEEMKERMKG